MAASSARNLMSRSGTVSTTSGSKTLAFSASQSFKEGTTIIDHAADGEVSNKLTGPTTHTFTGTPATRKEKAESIVRL